MNNINKILGVVLMLGSVFISTMERISIRVSVAIVEAGYASGGTNVPRLLRRTSIQQVYSYTSCSLLDSYYWLRDSRGVIRKIVIMGIARKFSLRRDESVRTGGSVIGR